MLYVRLVGELPPVFLPAGPPSPVAEALGAAAQMWGKDPEQCRLRCGDTILEDPSKPLAEYGVSGNEVLDLEAL